MPANPPDDAPGLLRRAAAHLDKVVAGAPDPPWHHRTGFGGVHFVTAGGDVVEDHLARIQNLGPGRRSAPAIARYMATVDPAVGHDLADWLREYATALDAQPDGRLPGLRQALDIAAGVLGVPAITHPTQQGVPL